MESLQTLTLTTGHWGQLFLFSLSYRRGGLIRQLKMGGLSGDMTLRPSTPQMAILNELGLKSRVQG